MRTRHQDGFTTVRTEGAILPRDLLARIAAGDKDLGGLSPDDYHLSGERLNEATNRAWNRLQGAWAAFRRETDALRPEVCLRASAVAPGAAASAAGQGAAAASAASAAAGGRSSTLDPGTSPTRERWLLPLFQELGYGRLQTSRAAEIDGRTYAVSHAWVAAGGDGPIQLVPIHLVGLNIDLDKRTPGVAGAAQAGPHSLLQEYLNRSDEHLWGFVSNGLRLRILRDNRSLTRQAYVEFDLEAMMNGEAYSDFALLYLLCHQSRVEGERPEECWLEKWSRAAEQQGTRALDQLRKGVEEAIGSLGAGFLAHPENAELRRRLQEGELSPHDYYRDLLRLVYRLLFLFVAEDRGLLLDPAASRAAKDLYTRFYSTARLRRLAERRRGGRHSDLYRGLRLVMEKLGREGGCPELVLPALGGFLFSEEGRGAAADAGGAGLAALDIQNRELLAAVRALAFTTDGRVRRAVDYRNLGSEELGSVYEALLELHPEVNVPARTFALTSGGGSERKTTGSYYTPSSLIQCLLDSALDPVVDEAVRGPDPEAALLSLRICDPACGSGHFLVAAAHRLAKRLAAVRTGDEEPSPEAQRGALRDVIGHCLYGVDVNPMAVELCKVSLWMEAVEPGRPLSFLDHRILCGNSLLGATPALLADGIPDEAFQALEGDDKKVVSELKKQNRQQRKGQETLFAGTSTTIDVTGLARTLAELDGLDDDSLSAVRAKEERYRSLGRSEEYRHAKLAADAWCAAFVCRKVPGTLAVTQDVYTRLVRDPRTVPEELRAEIERLADEYRFFHWHLAFPEVLAPAANDVIPADGPGWSGGFDVVLGNPPWDQVQLDPREFFAALRPDIATAQHMAARDRAITSLKDEDPVLYRLFAEERRRMDGVQHMIHNSGLFPLTSFGRLNSAPLFTELGRHVVASAGRAGVIVPSGIATDSFNQYFFQSLIDDHALVSLYDFENRNGLFPSVHRSYKFSLLTLAGLGAPVRTGAEFAFFCHETDDLRDEERRFSLSAEDIALLNPNTRTCPVFRTRRDAEITKGIYRRVPVLLDENKGSQGNPWGFEGMLMFMMNTSSGLFRTREQLEAEGWLLKGNVFVQGEETAGEDAGPGDAEGTAASRGERYLPLYEAKMIHHFDHRWATYDGLDTRDMTEAEKADPSAVALPRYWVPESEVDARLRGRWDRGWLLGWRDICRSTDERTVIASVVPRAGTGDTLLLMFPDASAGLLMPLLSASLDSVACDYAARQKIGGTHLKYHVFKQLPVLPPAVYREPARWAPGETVAEWMLPRVLELVYTSWEMQPLARDCGYDGPPFVWDEERRFQLRCELDAAFFHLYGIGREDVEYIMDTFLIVRRKDEARWGEYRTKQMVLDYYQRMQ